ncbi:hypothetical protein IWQ61_001416 [Dispira simplex]|nr:hypothetical protein IWQ61_001416 [Dispira simplex]
MTHTQTTPELAILQPTKPKMLAQKILTRPPPFAADLLEKHLVSNLKSTRNIELETSIADKIQARINALALVRALRGAPEQFKEFCPYWPMEPHVKQHHLVSETLGGASKLPVDPLTFRHKASLDPFDFISSVAEAELSTGSEPEKMPSITDDTILKNTEYDAMTQIQYLGRSLCGHDGIIHGGLLATIIDEAFARLAFPFLPGYSGFTANLNLNYRAPVPADHVAVVIMRVDKVEGRKAYLTATMKSLDGSVQFLEATSLFIAPKPRE